MRQTSFLFLGTLLLGLLLILAGCGSGNTLSPTPFPTIGPTATLAGTGPIRLNVTELMSAPGLYRDVQVQLTGRLRKQPVIICENELHPSPATWGLAEEGVLALAGGYDMQVRSLLPDDLSMTVEGRWRRWEGLVGCGKQATQREVWFLEVGRILTPSPLTQVTLTPASGIEIVEVTAVATLPITPTLEGEIGDTSPVTVTIESETPESLPGFPTPTVDLFLFPSPEVVSPTDPIGTLPGITPPSSLTGTPPLGGSGTPGSQLTLTPGGTPSPTTSGTPPLTTPTATTPSSGQVVPKGNLYDEMFGDFITSSLAGGTIDSWEVDIFEDESLYIYVVAPNPADIILSVLKGGQPIVNRQNTAPAGSPEFINNPALQGEGIYEIQVLTTGGVSTDYALTFYTDPEIAVIFPGIITPGQPRSAVQLQPGSYQYWFFVGNAATDVRINLIPLGNEDPAVYLYGPDGEEIQSADDGFEGDEEIMEATLEISGLHAIGIEELYGESLTYDLVVTVE